MKGAWFACIALIMMKASVAQDACPEFSRLMTEADQFAAHKDYRKALNKYNSAKTCSPAQRSKVDEKINQLFEKIQAESKRAQMSEVKIRSLYDSLNEMIVGKHKAEEEKKKNDSANIASLFSLENKDWLTKLPEHVQKQLLTDIIRLKETGRHSVRDSLASAFKQLVLANDWTKAYSDCAGRNEQNPVKLVGQNAGYIQLYGSRLMEDYYYLATVRLENASNLLPTSERSAYIAQISTAEKSLKNVRLAATRGYYLPDKVIGLPAELWLYDRCANNQDFVMAYLDRRDYNKLQVHYVNYSLPNFVETVDSSEVLADSGKLSRLLAASADFKNTVGRALSYTLKKNRAEIKDTFYVVPNAMNLFDSAGNIITQFGQDIGTTYYFSPDGTLVVTWKDQKQLVLYNINLQKPVPLTDNTDVRAMSISTDSRTIAYYNPDTRTIYFSGTDGRQLFRIPLAQLGLTDLDDIEFTGSDQFLRINAVDSILLLHIPERKILLSFSSQPVQDIVVSPNGKDILLNCNVTYVTSSSNTNNSKTNYENLALIVDQNLYIKGKLLGDVQHLFFTPDGRYVIGYNNKTLVRWTVDSSIYVPMINQSFISTEELIDNNYLPYLRYDSINNANQIETGAYNLFNLAGSQTDTLLQGLYYRQSENLFDRLAFGNAKNILAQRIPFYYDWYNWIEQRLGNKNFNAQFSRQQAGVELFDKMVNSPDSVYPQQLFYAANSHRIFGRLYDSLRYYNPTYLALIREEIALRQRVLLKDPDNTYNNDYLNEAYLKFSSVCNIMGDTLTANKQYSDRLALFRMEEDYLSNRQRLFYDTLSERKTAYANALAHLATSFIYVYASRSNEYKTALDSAYYYADKGLRMTSHENDAASLLMAEAFAYLLKDELEKAIDACRTVRSSTLKLIKKLCFESYNSSKGISQGQRPTFNEWKITLNRESKAY